MQKAAAEAEEQAKKDKVKAKKEAAKAAEQAAKEEKRKAKMAADAKEHAQRCKFTEKQPLLYYIIISEVLQTYKSNVYFI